MSRPDNHPFLGRVERRELRQVCCRFLTDSLCQSEIEDLDGAAGRRFDVGRLQIPMNDALGVRRLECFGCLARDRQRVVQRQLPLMNAIGERCSVDEFEDQRDDVFAFFERVDGGDVGMVQRRKDLRLAFEASDPGGVGRHRRRKHFDGDVSTELDIARSVHFTHSAGADTRNDFVLAEPSSHERRMGVLTAGRAWIERRLLEKVVGGGFIEQRLDVALERLVSGARIVEKRGPALWRQHQRFVKQPFDVQPVLWIHRTR